ncbi:hypothetical protein [Lysinibacillus sp. SGAir0095]|uniref:hypothetical protein n=1 Tax=Lysinibacillus sp. SGAir0095 TaxID=2070463 RepID=UPI0010CCFBE7|nr:hypothetical protein [Lysinibacillus sp. SGAir0095]QCR33152.1 hypothetical protein C1N55_13605 [Lysinibacillus sp. SGAir0095]
MTKNGIPLDIPGQRKKTTKVQVVQKPRNDYNKYNTFATMSGFENRCYVTAIVPTMHPEFKVLKKQGYRVLEVWDKRKGKEEVG